MSSHALDRARFDGTQPRQFPEPDRQRLQAMADDLVADLERQSSDSESHSRMAVPSAGANRL